MADVVDLDPIGAQLGHRLAALVRAARREVLALHPDLPDAPALVTRLADAAGRGVVVRHVVPGRGAVPAGTDVRVGPTAVPAGLFVVDRQQALVLADGTAAGSVVLSDQGSVTLLCALFERIWADALPAGGTGQRLTDQQATAVRLLADGHTDESIAKRLGVSSRTARRIVTLLMNRLDARGRFQAGVRAVEAGWLAERPANPAFDIRTTG